MGLGVINHFERDGFCCCFSYYLYYLSLSFLISAFSLCFCFPCFVRSLFIVIRETYQEHEQQQHQQKQHGFCDWEEVDRCCRSPVLASISFPAVDTAELVVLSKPPMCIPPVLSVVKAAERSTFTPPPPGFPLPPFVFCDVELMLRKRHPVGNSETVHDIFLQSSLYPVLCSFFFYYFVPPPSLLKGFF